MEAARTATATEPARAGVRGRSRILTPAGPIGSSYTAARPWLRTAGSRGWWATICETLPIHRPMCGGLSHVEPRAHPPPDRHRRCGATAVAERARARVTGAAAWPEAGPLRQVVLSQPAFLWHRRDGGGRIRLGPRVHRLPDAAVHGTAHRHLALRSLLPRLSSQRPHLPLRRPVRDAEHRRTGSGLQRGVRTDARRP